MWPNLGHWWASRHLFPWGSCNWRWPFWTWVEIICIVVSASSPLWTGTTVNFEGLNCQCPVHCRIQRGDTPLCPICRQPISTVRKIFESWSLGTDWFLSTLIIRSYGLHMFLSQCFYQSRALVWLTKITYVHSFNLQNLQNDFFKGFSIVIEDLLKALHPQ